jgi:hypothetical protein
MADAGLCYSRPENPGLGTRRKATADPSTPLGAKYAPNYTQDDKIASTQMLYCLKRLEGSSEKI